MSRSICSVSYEHPASAEDRKKFMRAIQFMQKKFTYKRIKGGYDCYCSCCGEHFTLTDEQLLQTKEAGLCFKCAESVRVVQRRPVKETVKRAWLSILNENNAENGYMVTYKGDEIIGCLHVLHYDGNGGRFVYGIVKNMGYSITYTENKSYWRKEATSYNPYRCYFYEAETPLLNAWKRKKDYYQSLKLDDLKSNQKTFIKKGIYNERQLDYIRVFDLDYPEQLHKYNKYIQIHAVRHADELKLSANILEYLVSNNFPIAEYTDYLNACKQLGLKPQKPKDLYKAHDDLVNIIKIAENKECNERIIGRYPEMQKNEWHKGKLAIHSFKDFSEMEKVATKLNNCIARLYAKPYSQGTTDVYYGTEDGQITFALEVANGKMMQLRGSCNRGVSNSIAKFVKGWCKKHGYQYA